MDDLETAAAETDEGPPRGRGDDPGRVRLCAVTRERHPEHELIRFVAGPDGAIVPDLARRLPGRGVWIGASRETVAAAVRSKVFARSLKRQVAADPGLAEQVERLLERRAIEALSLANKAGLVVTGFAKIEAALGKGQGVLLVHGTDAAADGRSKLDRKLAARARDAGHAFRAVDCLTIDQLSLAIGRQNVVHALLETGGATEKFAGEAGRLMRYRSVCASAGPDTAAHKTLIRRATDEA